MGASVIGLLSVPIRGKSVFDDSGTDGDSIYVTHAAIAVYTVEDALRMERVATKKRTPSDNSISIFSDDVTAPRPYAS